MRSAIFTLITPMRVLMTGINTHHLGLCVSDIQNCMKVVLDLQLGVKTPMSTVHVRSYN